MNEKDGLALAPLHYAAHAGLIKIVDALLARGAQIGARGEYDDVTPLMLAVSNNQTDVISVLLAAGADVNASDWHGYTALHSAALEGEDPQEMERYLASGVYIDQPRNDGARR